jgi:hypothetical protein
MARSTCARHYSPTLGRFLQRDSVGGSLTRPQSLNRYSYAENNPATHTDPSGHCIGILGGADTVLCAVIIGVVIGGDQPRHAGLPELPELPQQLLDQYLLERCGHRRAPGRCGRWAGLLRQAGDRRSAED